MARRFNPGDKVIWASYQGEQEATFIEYMTGIRSQIHLDSDSDPNAMTEVRNEELYAKKKPAPKANAGANYWRVENVVANAGNIRLEFDVNALVNNLAGVQPYIGRLIIDPVVRNMPDELRITGEYHPENPTYVWHDMARRWTLVTTFERLQRDGVINQGFVIFQRGSEGMVNGDYHPAHSIYRWNNLARRWMRAQEWEALFAAQAPLPAPQPQWVPGQYHGQAVHIAGMGDRVWDDYVREWITFDEYDRRDDRGMYDEPDDHDDYDDDDDR